MSDLEKLIESNAKAISALTSDIAEMKRDRNQMYGMMRDLANHQIRSYELLENLDGRQQQLSNQQHQLIEIQKSINSTLEKLTDKPS